MNMKNIIVLTISLLLLSNSLYAAETGYEVELIIFETNDSYQLEAEDWSYNDMLNNDKDIAEIKNDYHDKAFIELDWQQAKLADSLAKIESSERYTVLYKKRWRQTGLDRATAYAIEISSLEETSEAPEKAVASDLQNPIINTNILNNPMDNITIDVPTYIQGRVKLIMSRYLHFEVNLNYFKMNNDVEEPGYRSFPVVSERRMRSREIHYIDHPMVGIIVYALPFKIEADISPDETNIESTAIN